MMRRLVTFDRLKAGSFAHSAVYLGLLVVWLTPGLAEAEAVFGWLHGLGWIAMCVLVIVGLRLRVISLWLAVLVAVIGGIGPFAGSAGFLVEERRGLAPGARPETDMV